MEDWALMEEWQPRWMQMDEQRDRRCEEKEQLLGLEIEKQIIASKIL